MNRLHTSYADATSPTYTTRLCTSWLLPTPFLCLWRALISLYAFVVLFTIIGRETSTGDSWAARASFSYFTVLGYWGLAFYYAFAAAHTGSYWVRGRSWLQGWPSGLRWAHGVFYASVTVWPFLVTAVFWAPLSSGAFATTFSTWTNISEHALNSVFAFSEILLPHSQPHPWINLPPLVVLLAAYLGLAYITHATEGFYVYGFLSPSIGRGVVAGACIGILAAMLVLFGIVRYAIMLRLWVTETKLGMTGKFPSRARSVGYGEDVGGERGDAETEGGGIGMEAVSTKAEGTV